MTRSNKPLPTALAALQNGSRWIGIGSNALKREAYRSSGGSLSLAALGLRGADHENR